MLSFSVYIGIYISITVIAIVCSVFNISIRIPAIKRRKAENIIIILFSMTIAILASLRPEDTPDTLSYYSTYSYNLSFSDFTGQLSKFGMRYKGMEILFVASVGMLKSIGCSFRFVLFFLAFTNSFLILYSSKELGREYVGREPNITRLIALFLSFFCYHYCCIAIRSGLGIGLGLLAIKLLINNKTNKIIGISVLLVACLIHSMTFLLVVPVLLLLFHNKKNVLSKKWIIVTSVVCIMSLILNLGSLVVDYATRAIKSISATLNISGYTGYVMDVDRNVGKKDWLVVVNILVVVYIISRSQYKPQKFLSFVMIGLYVTSFLYPIRAINRAADYFYIFLLPIIATIDTQYIKNTARLYLFGVANVVFLLYLMYL